MLKTLLILCFIALEATTTILLARRVQREVALRPSSAGFVFAGGILGGAVALLFERLTFDWTGLSLSSVEVGEQRAVLATFLLAAPLEEAFKVLAVWPAYLRGRLYHPWAGIAFAAFSASGFSAAQALLVLPGAAEPWIMALRLLAAFVGHVFFAGIWGAALSQGGVGRGVWFRAAWLLAVLLHGALQHLIFGAGLLQLAGALPMLTVAVGAAWWVLRNPPQIPTPHGFDSIPPSRRARTDTASARPRERAVPGATPALRIMRRALNRSQRKLLLHWVALGSFVVLGAVISLLLLAVYVGNRIGIDFTLADQAGADSTPPLLILGASALSAFPLGAYFVARASGTDSVIEPAMASALALALLTAGLSMTAPQVFVFALAVSPLAFLLACGGAWFGLERE